MIDDGHFIRDFFRRVGEIPFAIVRGRTAQIVPTFQRVGFFFSEFSQHVIIRKIMSAADKELLNENCKK